MKISNINPRIWGIILQDFYEIVGIILLITGFILLGIGGDFHQKDWIICWAFGMACQFAAICVIVKRCSRSPWIWLGFLDLLFFPLAIPFYRYIRDQQLDHIRDKEPSISWIKLDNLAMLQLSVVAINWVWVLGYILGASLVGINSKGSIPWMIWFSLIAGFYLIGTIFTFTLLYNVSHQFPVSKGTIILSLFAFPATWPLGLKLCQKPQIRYINEN